MSRINDIQSEAASQYSQSEVDPDDLRWDDWEAEEEDFPSNMQCLFCSECFQSAGEVFHHGRQQHGFDFIAARLAHKLDFYRCMRLINFLRRKQLEDPEQTINNFTITGSEPFLNDDSYLQPVLDDDSLLFAFEDILDVANSEFSVRSSFSDRMSIMDAETALHRLKMAQRQATAAEARAEAAERQLMEYKQLVKEHFYDSLVNEPSSQPAESQPLVEHSTSKNSDYYFESYAQTDIHEQMLKDSVRTDSYRDFMLKNSVFFAGKVVLDVGCGTGILSMFAAKAGASKVYAVDNSDIIHRAKSNVENNGLGDIITFIKGRVEEISLPVEKVDIIISEWMGYFLLFEAMLDSVLIAKERFLSKNGILCPNYCQILLSGFQDDELVQDKLNYWDDVYGYKMDSMKDLVYRDALVDVIEPETILTTSTSIKDLPLMDVCASDLEFKSDFELTVVRSGTLHGLAGYFDTLFTTGQEDVLNWQAAKNTGISPIHADSNDDTSKVDYDYLNNEIILGGQGTPIAFTTGPLGRPSTHWKQTLLLFRAPLKVQKDMTLRGQLKCHKHSHNPRELALALRAELISESDCSSIASVNQDFSLS